MEIYKAYNIPETNILTPRNSKFKKLTKLFFNLLTMNVDLKSKSLITQTIKTNKQNKQKFENHKKDPKFVEKLRKLIISLKNLIYPTNKCNTYAFLLKMVKKSLVLGLMFFFPG